MVAALAGAAGLALWRRTPGVMPRAEFDALYNMPLSAPAGPVATYHLGHSLTGRDMPAFLAQMAGHVHASQLGWGAALQDHWRGEVPGFDQENAHRHHRPAGASVDSGQFGAIVMTEMVELRDAIRWKDSATHLALWAARARAANPAARVYLYETWHRLDDRAGWLRRIDADRAALWEDELLRPAMAQPGVGIIHVIPGGQVMAAAVRAIESGAVPGLAAREALFSRDAGGAVDPIHPGDLGNWLIALTHHATLYHRLPEMPSATFIRTDGRPADLPARPALLALEQVVWNVVTGYPLTGVGKI